MAGAAFREENQLCHDLRIENSKIFSQLTTQATAITLPGDPRIELKDAGIGSYLGEEFLTEDLNKLARYLWLMTTQRSDNISSLTEQLVRGRKIVISHKPGLHLVWADNRVFLKPLPKYLLSYAFWEYFLLKPHLHITKELQDRIVYAARGFIRTYAYLIQHEADFILATQETTRLVPKDINYEEFARFISRCQADIDDQSVSPRYGFGELRLTRLNFWSRIFLFKTTYHKVEWEYGAYFARFYGPILFIAVFSVLMSAMQIVLEVGTVLEPGDAWLVFARVARGFSLFTIFFTACAIAGLLFVLVSSFLSEAIYALKDLVSGLHKKSLKKM
ncbi:hypothetical protein F4806DRAFT_503786 [Annulohypoxylon nitens]|nr:hypothetical protein F4806DRAFT_503786 [Annulohypoxylon nitens]